MSLVKTNVLNADEIFSSRDAALNGPLKPVLLPAGPGGVDTRVAGVAEADLHDLGPVAGAVVALDVGGGFGDVDEAWAGVLDELVVEELEADLVACLDGVGGGVAGYGSLVATEIVGVDDVVGEGGVVGVAVLASVGILAADGGSVDDEAVEDVVGICTERRDERKNCGGLHSEVKGTDVVRNERGDAAAG